VSIGYPQGGILVGGVLGIWNWREGKERGSYLMLKAYYFLERRQEALIPMTVLVTLEIEKKTLRNKNPGLSWSGLSKG
jgi:hypothetical protein